MRISFFFYEEQCGNFLIPLNREMSNISCRMPDDEISRFEEYIKYIYHICIIFK